MSTTKRVLAGLLLLTAAVWSVEPSAWAQRDGRGTPPRPEVRGTIKAIDATARTLTVTTGDGRQPSTDRAFTIAKDTEVALGDGSGRRGYFKEGKLADLAVGTTVSLTVSADDRTVEGIAAEGPLVRGVLKAVDPAKNTLTVTGTPLRRERRLWRTRRMPWRRMSRSAWTTVAAGGFPSRRDSLLTWSRGQS